MNRAEQIERIAQQIVDGESLKDLSVPDDPEMAGIVTAFEVIDRISQSFRRVTIEQVEEPISIGDSWGHLEIKELLGAGGMGQVFRAYDRVLDCYVAAKFLSPRALQFVNSDLFIAEARRMAKVRHPNVLAVLGAGVFDQRPGFWSEYLQGENLHDVLVERALSAEEVLSYASNLADALTAVHHAGLVHGDVKPLNVMIEPNRGAVLMDFGAGIDIRNAPQNPIARQVTPAIMPPEQLEGHAVSAAYDVYGLGMLFYSLWTGRPPFIARTIGDLEDTFRRSRGPDLSNVGDSRAWRALIGSMISRDPADRPTMSQVVRALRRIRSAPLRRARRATTLAIIGLLLGVSLTAGIGYFQTRQEYQRTQAALSESQDYIDLLTMVVTSASPLSNGKETRMLDVLASAESRLSQESTVNEQLRMRTLKLIANTYANLNAEKEATRLGRAIAGKLSNPKEEFDLQLMLAKQYLGLNEFHEVNRSLDGLSESLDSPDISDSLRAHYWAIRSAAARELGDLSTARNAVNQALSLANSSAPSVITVVLIEDGHLLVYESEFDRAIGQFEKALESARAACQCAENMNTLVIESEIALCRLRKGDAEIGVQSLRELSARAGEFLGQDHKTALNISLNFIASLNETGQFEEVIQQSTQLRPSVNRRYGPISPESTILDINLANAHLYLGQYQQAKSLYRDVIGRAASTNGVKPATLLVAKYNLAELYYKSGDPQSALAVSDSAIDHALTELGSKNLISLELQDAKGWSLHLLGRSDEAIEVLTPLLELKREVLGGDHPLTLSTQQHLLAATEGH